MAQKEYRVSVVDGKVRIDLDDGTHTDFMPDQANKLAGLIIAAAHEAVYNDCPPSITMRYNYTD